MKAVSRRTFLKGAIASCLPLSFPSVVLSGSRQESGERPRVVQVQGPIEASLEVLLEELGGIGRFVKSGDTVLIKPNMSFPNPPEQATTTDPKLVTAMAGHCLRAGAKRVLVADHTMRAVKLCLEMTGMKAAFDDMRGVHLIGASQEGMFQRVALSGTRELKEVKVLRAALDADVHINLPRMKSHGATTVSLGMKGNMGLIWDRGIFHSRLDLNEAIGDLNTRTRADLTILDGSRVLTAGGPLGPGPVEELGCLIGGVDPVAVDAFGVQRVAWYGKRMVPEQIPHLVACHKRGIGEIDLDRVDVVSRKAPLS
jgi:uncharacterized protein (DUF362 family)